MILLPTRKGGASLSGPEEEEEVVGDAGRLFIILTSMPVVCDWMGRRGGKVE